MVLSLSWANFGSAALQKSLHHFPTNASMNRAGELNIGTRRSEGEEVEKQEDVSLRPPSALSSAVEVINALQESRLSDLKCSSLTKPFRTSKIPSPGWENR